jgi:hypothetical protein
VDDGIKWPEYIEEQLTNGQQELRLQGESLVRALVEKVFIYLSGHIEVQGVIDGSTVCLVKQNELPVP